MRCLNGHGHRQDGRSLAKLLLCLKRDIGRAIEKRRHAIIHQEHITLWKYRQRVTAARQRSDGLLERLLVAAIAIHREPTHALNHPGVKGVALEYIVRRHAKCPHADLPQRFDYDLRIAMGGVIGQKQKPRAFEIANHFRVDHRY